jgi:predicted acetyltransferase
MDPFEALVGGKLGNMAAELLRPTKLRELLQFYDRAKAVSSGSLIRSLQTVSRNSSFVS